MPDFKKTIAPCGSWPSPITSDALTAAAVGLSEVCLDGEDIYWLENRPEEKGRTTIIQCRSGKRRELLPAPLNCRSKVNEYGGGSYCVHEGQVYFVLFDDQRIYQLDTNNPKAIPEAITPAGTCRYADLVFDPYHQRLIAIVEDHAQTHREAQTRLVAVDIGNANGRQQPQTLQSGADFYASPALSPDGKTLCWLSWNHPNMPWDGTGCCLASVSENGAIGSPLKIAGGEGESIVQPQFSPAGELFFISDRSNWWNLYRYDDNQVTAVYEKAVEFGGPQWVFGLSYYSFLDANTVLGCYTENGQWLLYQLDLSTGRLDKIPCPCTDISYVRANTHGAVFVGAGPRSYEAVYLYQPQKNCTVVAAPVQCQFLAADLSSGQSIEFPLRQRAGKGQAFYYPPTNSRYAGPNNEPPPLLVFCHGGPTAATHSRLNLKIQYWTSRGIAVADINYGGSTGFGRRYRHALKGQWGIVDVQDCIDCVSYLVEQGLADKNKLSIRGGSAGGYTVLCALTFYDVFKAGASHYGVGDLETLATDTHKFESRYLDTLVGPYPRDKEIYQARSPIHHLDSLRCPVIFFQGLQDKVVPPNQAGAMVEALNNKGIPHAYVTFAEEGHGFRQAPNQRRALEAELYFYSKVFDFPLADNIKPVTIHHLNTRT